MIELIGAILAAPVKLAITIDGPLWAWICGSACIVIAGAILYFQRRHAAGANNGNGS